MSWANDAELLPLPQVAAQLTAAFAQPPDILRATAASLTTCSDTLLKIVSGRVVKPVPVDSWTRMEGARAAVHTYLTAAHVASVTALTLALGAVGEGGGRAAARLLFDPHLRGCVFSLFEWAGAASKELLVMGAAFGVTALGRAEIAFTDQRDAAGGGWGDETGPDVVYPRDAPATRLLTMPSPFSALPTELEFDNGSHTFKLPPHFRSEAVDIGLKMLYLSSAAREAGLDGAPARAPPSRDFFKWLAGSTVPPCAADYVRKLGGCGDGAHLAAAEAAADAAGGEAAVCAAAARAAAGAPPAAATAKPPDPLLAPNHASLAAITRVLGLVALLREGFIACPTYSWPEGMGEAPGGDPPADVVRALRALPPTPGAPPAAPGTPTPEALGAAAAAAAAAEGKRLAAQVFAGEEAAVAALPRPAFMANELPPEGWAQLWRAARNVSELGVCLEAAGTPWGPLAGPPTAEALALASRGVKRGADFHTPEASLGLHAYHFIDFARRAEAAALAWRMAAAGLRKLVGDAAKATAAAAGNAEALSAAAPGADASAMPEPERGLPSGRNEDDTCLESRCVAPASVALSASLLWLALQREFARSLLPEGLWPPAVLDASLVSAALLLAAALKVKALHNGKAGPMMALLPAAVTAARLWEVVTMLTASPGRGGLRCGVEVPRRMESTLYALAATPLRVHATSIHAVLLHTPASGLCSFVSLGDKPPPAAAGGGGGAHAPAAEKGRDPARDAR